MSMSAALFRHSGAPARQYVAPALLGGVRSMSSQSYDAVRKSMNMRLKEADPEVFDIIEKEKRRQRIGLELIPSENFTSQAVLDAVGSVMCNKYSEGYPNARYYGGNEFIDQAELLCQKRALEAYRLDPAQWGVNVQPLSGSPANFYVYSALLDTHARILSLDLPSGGHLSHGYQTDTKKISMVSRYFESIPYRLNPTTGQIDYDQMEMLADHCRPKIIVCGASAYSRHIDYARFRAVADKHKAILMNDMAHISGLVAAGVMPSPFEYADIVTTTTHKSLRGPRGAMIFYRKGVKGQTKKGEDIPYDFERKINETVFPGHQGGPHNHTITGLAVALKLATTPEYKNYQTQVLKNCQSLCKKLQDLGYEIVSGGTDNHLILVNMKPKGIDGSRVERVLELAHIAVNKNTVPGDTSALVPGGLRMGTPALTSRGFTEADFAKVAEFVDRGVKIAIDINGKVKGTKLADYKNYVNENLESLTALKELANDVEKFSTVFPTVGFEEKSMKYQ